MEVPIPVEQNFCIKIIHCGNLSIDPNVVNMEKYVFYMPMGIFSLGSILNKNGYDVELIHLDLEVGKSIDEILDLENIDAIGFDLHWANQSLNVLRTAAIINEINPNVFIFLGGYTASFYAQEILKEHTYIDAIIRGDGEVPIVELCQLLNTIKQNPDNSLKDFYNVQNLSWRGHSNKIVSNKISFVSNSCDMEQFDFTDIKLLRNKQFYRDASKYWTSFAPFNSLPFFMIEVGRGCVYNCLICGGGAKSQKELNNRRGQIYRSPKAVASSIKEANKYGFEAFFTCFDFEGFEAWYSDLFKEIHVQGINTNFIYECWSITSHDFIDKLSQNFKQVIISLSPDSANEKLRLKNKGSRLYYSNIDLESCLDYIATKDNIKVQVWFGFFLPGEIEKTIFDTISYIIRLLKKYHWFLEPGYMNINADPASPIYYNKKDEEIEFSYSTFNELLKLLEQNYIINNKNGKGLNLTSKPSLFSESEAVNYANIVSFFSSLLLFKNSLLMILSNEDDEDEFVENLRKGKMINVTKDDFHIDKIKEYLVSYCRLKGIVNDDIYSTIDKEYYSLSSYKPKPFDFYSLSNKKIKLTKEETNQLTDDFDF